VRSASLFALASGGHVANLPETPAENLARLEQLSTERRAKQSPTDYILGEGDLLSVRAVGLDDLTQRVRVEGDGTITLPLVNAVSVGGKTVTEAQRELTRRVGEFDGVAGLDGVRAVAVSPDGADVYASGSSNSTLVAFRRDPASGTLTALQVVQKGVGHTQGLDGCGGSRSTPTASISMPPAPTTTRSRSSGATRPPGSSCSASWNRTAKAR
jgi:polysaccharide biosynthesis/export protein